MHGSLASHCPELGAYLLKLMVHFAITKAHESNPNPLRPLNAARKTFAPNQDRIVEEGIENRLPSLRALHILEKELESIAQRPHIRIHISLQLKRLWNNLHRPILYLGVLASFEA